jgi:pyruvyltransferase
MNIIPLVFWNPERPIINLRLIRKIAPKRRVNNFGDLLSPIVVQAAINRSRRILRPDTRLNPIPNGYAKTALNTRRLLSVGSILHFAADDDIIWGSGRNGNVPNSEHRFTQVHVALVRGPLTRDFLHHKGIPAPEIYGDPALLIPDIISETHIWKKQKTFDVTLIPHFTEKFRFDFSGNILHAQEPPLRVIKTIAQSKLVISSSLHAIIIAESLGIPARLLIPRSENMYKYEDYYHGTGRPSFAAAYSLEQALRMGGEHPAAFCTTTIWKSFPVEALNTRLNQT